MTVSQETARLGRSALTRTDLGWQQRAACRGEDLDLFFGPPTGDDREYGPAKSEREAEAKWLCSLCPVRAQCLESALDRGEKYGIWGGLNEDERNRELRNRGERERRRQRREPAA